jgi:small subunit ribosomal protein S9
MVKAVDETKPKKEVKKAVKPVKAEKLEKKEVKKVKEVKVSKKVEVGEVSAMIEASANDTLPTEKVLETTKPAKKSKLKDFFSGTGRRKTAIASVFLYEKKGDITVNGIEIGNYFKTEQAQVKWMRPFHVLGIAHPTSKYSATVKVYGSGSSAQLGAIVHGLSRALAALSEDFAEVLKKNDLLTRDSRMVERKKYFLRKARKAPQYSKR